MINSPAFIGDQILQISSEAARQLTEQAVSATTTPNSKKSWVEQFGEATAGLFYDDLSAKRPFREELQETYIQALRSDAAARAAETADRLFTTAMNLTSVDQTRISQFLKNWGETHISSDLVGVLATRLHRAGHHQAAGEMMEVIADDIGIRAMPHRDMFARMADSLCTPNSWRDNELKISACRDFRTYLTDARQSEDLETGILTTAASEIWNVGEYTALTEPMKNWMTDKMDLSEREASAANVYVRVHAGRTELDHFLCAITAWEQVCHNEKRMPNPAKAGTIMETYMSELGHAYQGLYKALSPNRGRVIPHSQAKHYSLAL